MKLIPGGTFTMGGRSDQAYPDEFPQHKVSIDPFYMDLHEVTNREFAVHHSYGIYYRSRKRHRLG